nr:hypothetical protein [Tanacetum cinerariifolium]
MTQEAINNMIAQRVADALAEYELQRNSVVNGDTSNTAGTGPRTVHPTRECTYKDYLNCGPLKFNGTEGIIGCLCHALEDSKADDDCETDHLTRDCRSRAVNNNNNNNNRRATVAYQRVPTCFECGAQGHYKRNYPRLGNRNQGNQNLARNENAVARAYAVGTAGRNPDANVVTGTFLLTTIVL